MYKTACLPQQTQHHLQTSKRTFQPLSESLTWMKRYSATQEWLEGNMHEKLEITGKLAEHGVSLPQYMNSLTDGM